jgi:hypothetical protein
MFEPKNSIRHTGSVKKTTALFLKALAKNNVIVSIGFPYRA